MRRACSSCGCSSQIRDASRRVVTVALPTARGVRRRLDAGRRSGVPAALSHGALSGAGELDAAEVVPPQQIERPSWPRWRRPQLVGDRSQGDRTRRDPALPARARLAAVIATATLTGDDLRIGDVWRVAVGGAPAELTDEARDKMRAARRVVERAAHGTSEHTYGVNTGFGRFVSKSIPDELTKELQLRLLRSHACGVGEPYPDEIVRAAMLLRVNALAKGCSGARIETVELLLDCLNRGLLPYVPSRGSVGASGDLAPLAHLALPLIGEGEAWVNGERVNGADALASVGLSPVELEAKEGLSLINGTQFMAAFGALGLVRARRLAKSADIACALSL